MQKKINKIFIQKTKRQLELKKASLLKRINLLKKSDPFSDPNHVIDNAAIDTDVREQIGHDTIEAEITELNKHLSLVDTALYNIKKGRYGICEKCKSPINIVRLKIVPESRNCIDCSKKSSK